MDSIKWKSSLPEEEGRIRLSVLQFSLTIESLLSDALCCLLHIKNDSRSFGNTSRALSFSQKANILIDTNFLSTADAEKFEHFMSIRNQFIHNKEAKSFVLCLGFFSGMDNRLFRLYPEIEHNDLELRLEDIFHHMIEDILLAIQKILEDFKQNKHVLIYLPVNK